jgi:hypothetical protein
MVAGLASSAMAVGGEWPAVSTVTAAAASMARAIRPVGNFIILPVEFGGTVV